jgi:hypothetical protein
MPVIRIDPPKKDRGGFLADVGRLAQFYASPLRSIIGAASDTRGTSQENKEIYGTLPIEVDTNTGLVTAIHISGKGRGAIVADQRNAHANDAAAVLQRVYNTGVVPAKVPVGYLAAAKIVANLHISDPPEYLARADAAYAEDMAAKAKPVQSGYPNNPPFPVWESDNMGILIPPGGMAGYAQMTGASKLALTRGGRGRSTGVRRKRRKTRASKPRKRTARKARGRAKLKKGSAAAKRYMASIRRKRRK